MVINKEYIKSVCGTGTIILTFLAALYTTMWGLGVAPITKSQAENITRTESAAKAEEFKKALDEQKKATDELSDKVGELSETLSGLETVQERSNEIQNLLLQELRRR